MPGSRTPIFRTSAISNGPSIYVGAETTAAGSGTATAPSLDRSHSYLFLEKRLCDHVLVSDRLRSEDAMALNLLPVSQLGAIESKGTVMFGLWLPWISASDGNQVTVKIIHEADQFLQGIPPREFFLVHSMRDPYGDFWSALAKVALSPPRHARFCIGYQSAGAALRKDSHMARQGLAAPSRRRSSFGSLSAAGGVSRSSCLE